MADTTIIDPLVELRRNVEKANALEAMRVRVRDAHAQPVQGSAPPPPEKPSYEMVKDPTGTGAMVFEGTTPDETRQIIEGRGEPLHEDMAVPIIGAVALMSGYGAKAPLGAEVFGGSFAGKTAHTAFDFTSMMIGQYGVVEPAAKLAGKIHPILEPIVGLSMGITSMLTMEKILLGTSLKALTATAPKFWTGQFAAMGKHGLIPKQFDSYMADMAKKGDVGNTAAMNSFLDEAQSLAYNKWVAKQEVIELKKAVKLAKKAKPESTASVVNSLKKKIATSGSLDEADRIRLLKSTEEEAIHEFIPEFKRIQKEIIEERAREDWIQHPNKDFIDTFVAEGGITESMVKRIFRNAPEEAEEILKRLKEHDGLITKEGGADVTGSALASGNKDLRNFVKAMAETPSMKKIRGQKRYEAKLDFDEIYRNEIAVRVAEKQSKYLGRVLGESPKEFTKVGAVRAVTKGIPVERLIEEIAELKVLVGKHANDVSKALHKEATAVGKAQLKKLRAEHTAKLKELQLRTQVQRETSTIKKNLSDTYKKHTIHPEYRDQLQHLLKPLFKEGELKQLDLTPLTENMWQFLNRKYNERFAIGAGMLARKYDDMIKSVGSRPRNIEQYSLEELREIDEFVKTFKHVARTERFLAADARKIYANLVGSRIGNRAVVSIPQAKFMQKGGKAAVPQGKASVSVADLANGYFAHIKRMEFIVAQLDNWKPFGDAYNHIWKPIAEAEIMSHKIGDDVFKMYDSIVIAHEKAAGIGRFKGRYWGKTLPAIGSEAKPTKLNAVAMALNMGNKGNIKVLLHHLNENLATEFKRLKELKTLKETEELKGIKVSESTTKEIKDLEALAVTEEMVTAYLKKHLTKADTEYVASIHKFFDADIYPMIAKTYKEVMGGNLKRESGKYYPLRARREKGMAAGRDQSALDLLLGSTKKGRAGIVKSMVMERTEGLTTLDLTLDPIISHLRNSVHLSTHWKAIQDVRNVISNPVFRKGVKDTLGENILNQFDPWLANVARPYSASAVDWGEGFMRGARRVTTVAILGARITTGAKQSLSLLTAIPKKVGPQNMTASAIRFAANPGKLMSAVAEASPMMAYRIRTWQREIAEAHATGVGKSLGIKGTMRNAAFYFIHTVDRMTASVVWQGAYLKGLDEFAGDGIKAATYADDVVRTTQPAASAKDLPAIMRGTERDRWISMFQGFFNVWHNQVAEIFNRGLAGNISKAEMMATLMYMGAVPTATWQGVAYGSNKIANKFTGRDYNNDVEEYVKSTLLKVGAGGFAGMPGVNAIVSSMALGYDYQVSPVTDIGENLVRVGQITGKKLAGEGYELTREDWLAYAQLGLYMAEAPSAQILTTVRGALRLIEGDTKDFTELAVRKERIK